MRWLIIEDEASKAPKIITEILLQRPDDEITWFYAANEEGIYPIEEIKDIKIDEETQSTNLKDYTYKGLFKSKDNPIVPTAVSVVWTKNADLFSSAFKYEMLKKTDIILLDIHLPCLTDDRSEMHPLVVKKAKDALASNLNLVICFISAKFLPDYEKKQIIANDEKYIKNQRSLQVGQYNQDYNNRIIAREFTTFDTDRPIASSEILTPAQAIKISFNKWKEISSKGSTIDLDLANKIETIEFIINKSNRINLDTYLKFSSFFTSNDFHNSISLDLKEDCLWVGDSWDVPIQILAIIKLLNYQKNTFFNDLNINKKTGSFPSNRAIFETLKTFGTKGTYGISIMQVFLVFWFCYRKIFKENYPKINQLFVNALLGIEKQDENGDYYSDPNLTKESTIIPHQSITKRTNTLLLLHNFVNVLLPKKSNKGKPTLENIEFLTDPIKLIFTFDIKVNQKLYKNIVNNQKILFNNVNKKMGSKLKGDFSTTLIKFLKSSYLTDIPSKNTSFDENTPIIGSMYNCSLYPSAEGEKLEIVFG